MTEESAGTLAEMLDERRRLFEVAVWMSGSAEAADGIVQETYRRWYALDDPERAGIAVPRAWLTRTAGTVCLELLADGVPSWPPRGAVPDVLAAPRPVRREPQGDVRDRHHRVVSRFAAACVRGDVAALKEVLDGEVTVVSDAGGKLRAAVRPVRGAEAVARFVTVMLAGQPDTDVAVESVNGRAGLVVRREGQAVAVIGMSVADTGITAVWIMLNPDKLRHWHRP